MRFRLEKGFWTSRVGLGLLIAVAACFLLAACTFTYYYVKYSRMIDARLSGHVLQNTTQIFSAPERISDGQAWSQDDLVMYLQRAGYRSAQDDNSMGQYVVNERTVDEYVLSGWRWNEGRYGIHRSLRELVDILNKVC